MVGPATEKWEIIFVSIKLMFIFILLMIFFNIKISFNEIFFIIFNY